MDSLAETVDPTRSVRYVHRSSAVVGGKATTKFDQVGGVIYALTSEDYRSDEIIEGYDSADVFLRILWELGDY